MRFFFFIARSDLHGGKIRLLSLRRAERDPVRSQMRFDEFGELVRYADLVEMTKRAVQLLQISAQDPLVTYDGFAQDVILCVRRLPARHAGRHFGFVIFIRYRERMCSPLLPIDDHTS